MQEAGQLLLLLLPRDLPGAEGLLQDVHEELKGHAGHPFELHRQRRGVGHGEGGNAAELEEARKGCGPDRGVRKKEAVQLRGSRISDCESAVAKEKGEE